MITFRGNSTEGSQQPGSGQPARSRRAANQLPDFWFQTAPPQNPPGETASAADSTTPAQPDNTQAVKTPYQLPAFWYQAASGQLPSAADEPPNAPPPGELAETDTTLRQESVKAADPGDTNQTDAPAGKEKDAPGKKPGAVLSSLWFNPPGTPDATAVNPFQTAPDRVASPKFRYEPLSHLGVQIKKSRHFRYPDHHPVLAREFERHLSGGHKPSVLVVGIANGEEPLSYLATINQVAQKHGKPLDEAVDLAMVDLQHSPSDVHPDYALGRDHLFKAPVKPPQTAVASFKTPDRTKSGEYEYCDSIRSYLENRLTDPEKTRFNTPVETFKAPDGGYDVVSCNNVLQYFTDEQFGDAVKNILNLVKPGGLLIMRTDAGGDEAKAFREIPEFSSRFEKDPAAPGIYRRKAEI